MAVQPVCEEAAAWVDVIQVDFENAYTQALGHLLQLGHKNIVYCGVLENPNASDDQKNQGWVSAVKKLKLTETHTIGWNIGRQSEDGAASVGNEGVTDDFIYQTASHDAMMAFAQHLENSPEKITALVCASDEVALAFQSYLQSRGKKLPQDLSIIGYDGISLGARFYPALTTIAPDYDKMAEVAVKRLIHHMSHKEGDAPSPSQVITVEPRLVIRSSTQKV